MNDYFYYSDVSVTGWRVIRHDYAEFDVERTAIKSSKETIVLASLRNDNIAAQIAFQYNAGIRTERIRVNA